MDTSVFNISDVFLTINDKSVFFRLSNGISLIKIVPNATLNHFLRSKGKKTSSNTFILFISHVRKFWDRKTKKTKQLMLL